MAQIVKNLPAIWKTCIQSLGWEDPLEKEMATHFSILAWRIPWTDESGRPQSMRSQTVTERLSLSLSCFINGYLVIKTWTLKRCLNLKTIETVRYFFWPREVVGKNYWGTNGTMSQNNLGNSELVQCLLVKKLNAFGDFPGGTMVKNLPCNAGDKVQSLVRELRSHVPHSLVKKKN